MHNAIDWLKAYKGRRAEPITKSRVVALVQADDCQGICCACGQGADCVEPDAEGYTCEACGEPAVFGSETLFFELGIGT